MRRIPFFTMGSGRPKFNPRKRSRRSQPQRRRTRSPATEALEPRLLLNGDPVVVDVLVSGQGWAAPPFSLLSLPATERSVGFANADQVHAVFDEPVDVESSDLNLVGVNNPTYTPSTQNGFNYDVPSRTATWNFDAPFGADQLILNLDGDSITASPGGQLLNGGRDFQILFGIVPGDVSGDGIPTITDIVRIAATHGDASKYRPDYDLDGDGGISVADLTNAASQILKAQPPNPPFPPPGAPPLIVASLVNDTGFSSLDGITTDPTVTGSILEGDAVTAFRAGFSPEVDVLTSLQPAGTFSFDLADLETINGGPLGDGDHTLHLEAENAGSVSMVTDVDFTLDRIAPTAGLSIEVVNFAAFSAFDVEYTEPMPPSAFNPANYSLVDGQPINFAVIQSGPATAVIDTGADLPNDEYTLSIGSRSRPSAGNGCS